jgi:hypothetical protein
VLGDLTISYLFVLPFIFISFTSVSGALFPAVSMKRGEAVRFNFGPPSGGGFIYPPAMVSASTNAADGPAGNGVTNMGESKFPAEDEDQKESKQATSSSSSSSSSASSDSTSPRCPVTKVTTAPVAPPILPVALAIHPSAELYCFDQGHGWDPACPLGMEFTGVPGGTASLHRAAMGGVGGAHLHSMSRGSVAGRSAEGTTLASSASAAAAALVAAVSGGGEGGGQDGDRGDGEGRDAASQDDIAAMSAIQLRRQVLMDNLIAMGFPVEWSIRYEEESKLSYLHSVI